MAGAMDAHARRGAVGRVVDACSLAYLRMRLRISRRRGRPSRIARWSNRLAVHVLRRHFDPSQTPDVLFEINTDCNYRCPFCPQAMQPRAPRYATRAAFDRLVAELQRLNFANELILSVNNEPFLHPDLTHFCMRVSDALPHATVALLSNGSMITRAHLKAFATLLRPPVITVNDYTPGRAVIRRLQAWLAEPCFARLPVTLRPRSRDEPLSNRAGNLPGGRTPSQQERSFVCTWPFTAVWVAPTLEVFLCCSDYGQTTIVGDLNRQSLPEVWNAPPLQRIRAALLVPDRGRIPLCAKCDAQWWRLPRHCRTAEFVAGSQS